MIINQIIHKTMQTYPTNLTENQWKVIENILTDNRKRKHNLKEIFNAIFYLLKTGCRWWISWRVDRQCKKSVWLGH